MGRNLREGREELMMMTTDVALVHDDIYREIVEEYANDLDSLNREFAASWEKLTTDGATWAEQKKCIDASHSYKKKGKGQMERGVYEAAEVDNGTQNVQHNDSIYIGAAVVGLSVIVMTVAIWKYVCSRNGMKQYITESLSEEYGATLEMS